MSSLLGATNRRASARLPRGTSRAYELVEQMASASPARRTGRPSEIAPIAVYLASDDASYVQGTVITLDGGWSTARV